MRRLERSHEEQFAKGLTGDPRTARVQFAIEMSGASVWRSSDSRAFVVMPASQPGEVHVLGIAPRDELMRLLSPLPMDATVTMSEHMYATMTSMVTPRAASTMEIYIGTKGIRPSSIAPPSLEFEVRSVLYSDVSVLNAMPLEASFLFRGYGDPKTVLARSAAFGAFNGTRVASVATAEMGRTYGTVWAYTVPDRRGRGLATGCVAALMDRLIPTGVRPLFFIRAENGSPQRAMARRFGLELAAKQVSVARGEIAL